MGTFNFPIDLTNLMIASMALGICVDDTIHFLYYFKLRFEHHANVERAIEESLRHSGRAIITTSIILISATGLYTLATLEQLSRFGMLVGLTIMLAVFADLIIGPAVLRAVYLPRSQPDPAPAAPAAQSPALSTR